MNKVCRKKGGWGASVPPVFGQTVHPISTRGEDYAHHSTTIPPGFSDLATALYCSTLFKHGELKVPKVYEL